MAQVTRREVHIRRFLTFIEKDIRESCPKTVDKESEFLDWICKRYTERIEHIQKARKYALKASVTGKDGEGI